MVESFNGRPSSSRTCSALTAPLAAACCQISCMMLSSSSPSSAGSWFNVALLSITLQTVTYKRRRGQDFFMCLAPSPTHCAGLLPNHDKAHTKVYEACSLHQI